MSKEIVNAGRKVYLRDGRHAHPALITSVTSKCAKLWLEHTGTMRTVATADFGQIRDRRGRRPNPRTRH